jgi:hypothetical protein
MTAPFIFISTYAIKEGQLEAFRQFLEELFGVLEPNVPGLLAINAYLDESGTEAAIVQVHTDVASMKEYWKVPAHGARHRALRGCNHEHRCLRRSQRRRPREDQAFGVGWCSSDGEA